MINSVNVVYRIANKAKDLSNKVTLNDVIKIADISRKFVPVPMKILPHLIKKFGTGITLTNNEIKDIMKIIKFLENRGILLKGTTRKTISREGRFLDFLRPLMTAGLPLLKNVLTLLAKSILIPLGLTAAALATDAANQKKMFG